ncbi:1-deoxy-D-xylulose-5-phosphate reductoisomerase [Trueperella bialowiezensis]|uniref:1-deoxy-D-xylulose 5-phosphate reductoisomerase n=1 Tax=Trueperella bialowiezensis TaxID=312285 RepID=A0A3S4Z4C9_9ACTO|nr:1-deoxy-D-xylulose-5-phosphate reductoisomerase [Trueperella bialowiezensis]VEI12669.1 1-deoxy-D-xylulose 5-phosphate reductoisomerase [Trueperella bialowiezensis]
MRDVVLLGSTGSIGTQALEVIAAHSAQYRVMGLGAGGGNIELLATQARDFAVPRVAIAADRADEFVAAWEQIAPGQPAPQVDTGAVAMVELAGSLSGTAEESGVVLNGITGAIGLEPTLAALRSGATLALANKESLVVGGGLIAAAMAWPGQIVPVDSEHSALAQALTSGRHAKGLTSRVVTGESEVRRLILTASGGPFRGWSRAELAKVTPEQALNHPTWDMGPVVTINSSTLMNKGLELIEAALLFDVAPADITVVIHPQSVIHSMVEFIDGSTISQASPPDMRLPIALGLSWPRRLDGVARPCSWDEPAAWTFEPYDASVFPAIDLARQAVAASALHPAVLNAANEEGVAAFRAGTIGYLDIVDTVARVLDAFDAPGQVDLAAVHGADEWARRTARTAFGA